jgi:hypothetical protein
MKEGALSIPDSEGPIVFVIDDDPLTRGSLSSLFRSVGLNVKALASAAELLEIITRSGIPAGVFNLVVGSGSTSSPGSPILPLRVCTNCCPGMEAPAPSRRTHRSASCLTFTQRYHSATRLSRACVNQAVFVVCVRCAIRRINRYR